ncbi:MAG: hypothetical protein QOK15_1803 [Nocardioidaceae bacterium]|nr:hypothetical protein [Nocardioidaceae bacterium]
MPGPWSPLAPGDGRPCHGFVTDLVVRCGQGDDAALALLFDLFHPLVGSLAVAHAPDHEVTDVVLEAFTRVWQRAPTFRPDAHNAVAWVCSELSSSVAGRAAVSRRRPAPHPGEQKRGGAVRRGSASAAVLEWRAPV